MSERPVDSGVEMAAVPAYAAALSRKLNACIGQSPRYPATLEVDAIGLDPWQWLNANSGQARVVWSDRDSSSVVAGVGVATSVERVAHGNLSDFISECRLRLGGNRDMQFFGGFSFDGADDWRSFGAGRFVVPRVCLVDGKLKLNVMSASDLELAIQELEQIQFEPEQISVAFPKLTGKKYLPKFDGWQSRIDEALSLIRSEVLEKVVLSRKTILEFSESLNPILLAEKLKAATHDCFVFCFDFGESSAFVGATPERLFFREDDRLRSEVVAGTRMRSDNPVEDERLAVELLTSDKDQREHDIVRKSIRQKLHKLVDHLEVDNQASILRLARKQHLRSNVEGTLKANVDDGMLLSRLHPTPAVGGYPTENALPEIARIEPFNRGWYAAPIGWIGADSAQFSVGIRSGLVEGKTLSLFSGAGIVRGSDPDEEWQEVENKIQDFIGVLER